MRLPPFLPVNYYEQSFLLKLLVTFFTSSLVVINQQMRREIKKNENM